MKLTKEQAPLPPPEYVLRLSYPQLDRLRHELFDLLRARSHPLAHPELAELFAAIKEHM